MSKRIRILVYEGPEDWMQSTFNHRVVKLSLGSDRSISEVTFDQLVNQHLQVNVPQMYDIITDNFRAVTQEDVDLLLNIRKHYGALAERIQDLNRTVSDQKLAAEEIRRKASQNG